MIPFDIIILASAFGALFPLSVADFDGNKEVGFYIYTRRGDSEDGTEVEIGDDASVEISGFDSKFSTKIIIHGFDDSYEGEEIGELTEAYLEKTTHNVIMVDWSGLAEHYKESCANARNIGQYIGKFILYLNERHGVQFEDVHLIGFELGGHIAGFVSDIVTGPKVGRITGLDPMGFSEWEKASTNGSLDQHDATTVDVFHTSSIGIKKPTGGVDFYPNGGVNQTDCKYDRRPHHCDRLSSIKYYVNSIFFPERYIGTKCSNVEEARKGACSGEQVQLGEFMQPTASGIFYKAI